MTIKDVNTHGRMMSGSFFSRYFERNAEQRYYMQLLEFMLWKRGKFILPHLKEKIQTQYIDEEIDFYNRNIINLPQFQFLVTTRCTLRCKNCNAYIPLFGNTRAQHIDLDPEAFQADMEVLKTSVNAIRRFMLTGGEPLLHPRLADLIEIAASSPIVRVVEIITNGTIMPGNDTLDAAEKFKERVYFHISNYSGNPALFARLKHEDIFAAFKERGIKYQMAPQISWTKEVPLQGRLSDEDAKKMFSGCWLKRCIQAIDGKIAICPKASCGFALDMADASHAGEIMDLRGEKEDLRQALIAFYQRDFFEVCRACVRIDEVVAPAEQL